MSGLQAWRALIAPLAAALAISCGSGSNQQIEEPSEIEGLIPNLNNSDIKLGSGYNTLSGDIKDRCVLDGDKSGQGSQIVTFSLRQITTMESLRTALEVGASASFNSGFYKGSAQANYFKSVNFNSFSSYLMVAVKVENAVQSLGSFVLTDSAKTLLATDQPSFVRACGDEFVTGMVTGGEFLAVVEFYASTREEKERTDASIRASGGTWNVAADFKKAMESLSQKSNLSAEVFRKGGFGKIPKLDNLIAAASEFPEEVAREAQPWVMSWTTKPYADLVAYQTVGRAPRYHLQTALMEDAARTVLLARTKRNDVEYVLANSSSFDLSPEKRDELERANSALANIINEYGRRAILCFDDPENECNWPTLAFPEVRLPNWTRAVPEGLDNQKCAAARRRALNWGDVSEPDFKRFERKNWGPFYHETGDPSSGIQGWGLCSVVAPAL